MDSFRCAISAYEPRIGPNDGGARGCRDLVVPLSSTATYLVTDSCASLATLAHPCDISSITSCARQAHRPPLSTCFKVSHLELIPRRVSVTPCELVSVTITFGCRVTDWCRSPWICSICIILQGSKELLVTFCKVCISTTSLGLGADGWLGVAPSPSSSYNDVTDLAYCTLSTSTLRVRKLEICVSYEPRSSSVLGLGALLAVVSRSIVPNPVVRAPLRCTSSLRRLSYVDGTVPCGLKGSSGSLLQRPRRRALPRAACWVLAITTLVDDPPMEHAG